MAPVPSHTRWLPILVSSASNTRATIARGRHFDVDELFDRQRVAEVVRERCQIVHPVGESHTLQIVLLFVGLLEAGVQVPYDWIAANHYLAVQLQHEPEHSMGTRVLRTHVEDHILFLDGIVQLANHIRGLSSSLCPGLP